MPDYCRNRVPGGTFFFTVNLLERTSGLLVAHIDVLREAVRKGATAAPFTSTRGWCCERGIWQRRFWEHTIRDDKDYAAHVDYVHINPVRHGLVACVRDWPHSSFHRCVARGVYAPDWAGQGIADLRAGERGT